MPKLQVVSHPSGVPHDPTIRLHCISKQLYRSNNGRFIVWRDSRYPDGWIVGSTTDGKIRFGAKSLRHALAMIQHVGESSLEWDWRDKRVVMDFLVVDLPIPLRQHPKLYKDVPYA